MRIIQFRYTGKYAHFRRPYSNVSALSFPFPPRTALVGLLGAVLGTPKHRVAKTFSPEQVDIGVRLNGPVRTLTHVTNLRQAGFKGLPVEIPVVSKGWKAKKPTREPDTHKPTQIPMELLCKPDYSIFIHFQDAKQSDVFEERLGEQRWVYTPCLGLSEFLAELKLETVEEGEEVSGRSHQIYSVLPKDQFTVVANRLEPGRHHIQELTVPHLGTQERTFTYRRYLVNLPQKEGMPVPIPVEGESGVVKFQGQEIVFL